MTGYENYERIRRIQEVYERERERERMRERDRDREIWIEREREREREILTNITRFWCPFVNFAKL